MYVYLSVLHKKKENLKYYAEFDGKQAQYYAECHCLSLMQLLQLLW